MNLTHNLGLLMASRVTGQSSPRVVPPSVGNTDEGRNQNKRTTSAASTALRQEQLVNDLLNESGRPGRDLEIARAAFQERMRAQAIDQAFVQRMNNTGSNRTKEP
jgi:hypothetical protein